MTKEDMKQERHDKIKYAIQSYLFDMLFETNINISTGFEVYNNNVIIYTDKPGILIGYHGKGKEELENLLNQEGINNVHFVEIGTDAHTKEIIVNKNKYIEDEMTQKRHDAIRDIINGWLFSLLIRTQLKGLGISTGFEVYNEETVFIYTNRPGILIGYHGNDLKKLKELLKPEGINNIEFIEIGTDAHTREIIRNRDKA